MQRRRSAVLELLEPRTLLSRATGIDVSSYQGSPTWSSVASSGVQFVYVKATQGNYYIDPDFSGDMSGATNAGIVAGAYDFADYTVNPTTEANYFLSTAGSWVGAGFLHPMLDVEASTSDTGTQVSNWVASWCNAIYSATGVEPIIYTYVSYADSSPKLTSTVTQWPLWMANYNGQNPQTGAPSSTYPWSSWEMWQYSSSGSVSGISGSVDMDVANGDMTTYVIPNLVGGSTQFTNGQVVHVNATGGVKAWNTYSSNGTYVTEPQNTTGVIKGGPVYIAGYLRWPVQYTGSSTVTWSAGTYLSAGGMLTVTAFSGSPNPVTAPNSVTLTTAVSDPGSTVSSVKFYHESNGTSGLQTGSGGDTLVANGVNQGSGNWAATIGTSGLIGSQTYYAVATDATGPTSPAVSTTVMVKVNPTLTWPAPAAIAYGTALSSAQLDATASVPGTFAYSPAAGTVLPAGQNQGLGVTFVPSDTTDYNNVVATTQITVNQATPTVSLSGTNPNPSDATQALSFTATVSGVPDGETVSLLDASNNNSVIATGTLSAGSASLSVPAGALLAGAHSLVAAYAGDANDAASQSAAYVQTVQVDVTGVVVNGNLPTFAGAQRSMVDSIEYTFSEPVTLGSNAFNIAVHSGSIGTVPTLNWAAINPDANGASAQWAVTFGGASVVGHSIANGVYDITLSAAAVTAESNPAASVASRATDTFYRLFGDVNGDHFVNAGDNLQFRAALTTYNAIFDYNADGFVNAGDNLQFRASLSLNLGNFVTTI